MCVYFLGCVCVCITWCLILLDKTGSKCTSEFSNTHQGMKTLGGLNTKYFLTRKKYLTSQHSFQP